MTRALQYAGAFFGSLAVAWLLTPLMLHTARRFGLTDEPSESRKVQGAPVPYLGGIAIVLGFAVSVGVAGAMSNDNSIAGELVVFLGVGTVLALVGLLDDLRGLPVTVRLALEIMAGLLVWGIGSGVDLPGPELTDAVITVVWVVGIANAFNLLDNMDGLTAGVAAIAATTLFVIAASQGQFLVASFAAAIAGCAVGFLRHNFHPATIYMGDAGSLFLGFLLAVVALRVRLPDTPRAVAALVPVVVLGIAIFDTSLVAIQRLRHRRSPFAGGRDHTSHRLVVLGLPVPVAVSLIYVGGVVFGWLAIILTVADLVAGLLLLGLITATALAAFVALASVPVYENSRRRLHMIKLVRLHETEPIDSAEPSDAASA